MNCKVTRSPMGLMMKAGMLGLRATTLVLMAGLLGPSSAVADVWFLGVGNDGYYIDVVGIHNAYTRLPNPHETPIHSRLVSNHGGSMIVSDIRWLSDSARPGDVAIFFYSGHGGRRSDYSGEERAGWAINSYDETIGLSYSWCTDDQLAGAFGNIDAGVPLVAIFDSCYAGGMVGGRDDLNALPNVYVMMSSREDQVSYGGSTYSRFTEQLINGLGYGLPADVSGDGGVTFGEWFAYADRHVYGQDPVSYDAGGMGALPIIPVPEPATVSLLAVGWLSTLRRRRRGQRGLAAQVGGPMASRTGKDKAHESH